MIKNILLTLAAIIILSNLLNNSEEKTNGYKILKKDAKTEIRLYEAGEKYRCTKIEDK